MKKIFFLSLLFISFLTISPKVAFAQILFQDDFEGNLNQWTVISGNWEIKTITGSNRYGTKIIPQFTVAETQAGDFSWTDYQFEVEMTALSGEDKNLFFRSTPERSIYDDGGGHIFNWPQGYGLHMSYNGIRLYKFLSNGFIDLASNTLSFPVGATHKFKIIAIANNIKVYVNENLLIDYIDTNSPVLQGRIALAASTGAAAPSEVYFDNVLVTSLEPSLTPTPTPLPVPYLSQKSEPWGSQEYDQASSWAPTQPTIARWGCALTSAAMTLLYHGINKIPGGTNLNPGSLNDWLKSQTDGYLREGHLNWYAITRLARLVHEEIGSTLLQFRRAGNDFGLLNDDLSNNRPPILKVSGHFIVATGKTNGSYFINDPAWEIKKTLEDYGNTFTSMRRLIPTSTNLSALLLVSDPEVTFNATNQEGNPVGESYFEEPLIDDIDGGNGGQGINIFSYNEPPAGTYNISASSSTPTSFTLDVYSYDEDANLTFSSFFGLTSPDNPATFSLTRTEEGNTENIQRTPTFARVKEDISQSLKLGLITKPQIAKILLAKINLAEELKNKGKAKNSKLILKDFLRELEIYHQKGLVKDEAYLLLKQDVEYLLKYL